MNANELFETGLEKLKGNGRLQALALFEKAYAIMPDPRIKSYIGYCIAFERGQNKKGEELCAEAISEEPGNAVNYLNLAKIYLKESQVQKAIEILREGIAYGNNEEISSLLDELSPRRRPFIPFLSRDNPINKYAGKLMAFLKL